MFNNITDTSISDASAEDILAAMGPEDGGKQKPAPKKTAEQKPAKSNASDPAPKASVTVADEDDFEEAFDNDEDDDHEDDETPAKKEKPAKKKAAKSAEEEEDDDENDEQDEDDENEENDNEEEEDEQDEDAGAIKVSDFLKARVKLLISKGEWFSFEKDGKKPEELEWTEELFEEIELEQRKSYKEGLREELLEGFGPYGREIANYTENGGNPDDLLDIFKEEQEVKSMDITNEQGQRDMVFEYLTKVMDRSPEKAKKDIERFIADKELEDEAKEAKQKIEAKLQAEREDLIANQEAEKESREKALKVSQEKFVSEVSKVVTDDESIPVDEKKQIIKVLTTFKKQLPNGTKVNDFYGIMAEFRKSLPNYIKMVRLVLDPNKYDKTLENKGKSKAADKAFSLARGSNANKKAKPGSELDGNRGNKKKTTGFQLYP